METGIRDVTPLPRCKNLKAVKYYCKALSILDIFGGLLGELCLKKEILFARDRIHCKFFVFNIVFIICLMLML